MALDQGNQLCLADATLRPTLEAVCQIVQRAGGRALLVGGCVRDAALRIPAKDLDFEVYGLEPQRLIDRIGEVFPLDLVGQSFGVLKLRHLPVDVSLPRRESKRGLGHKGFEIQSDPWMSPVEAASRRDFTINAIALDPLTGEVIDPFHGLNDLESRILRHTSAKFSEDPLRVLRAMQLAARFHLAVAPETIALCRGIEPEELARERLFEEWRKLMLLGAQPSLGLRFFQVCGWIRYYPELALLIGCPQDPVWHPEGDVWTHTLHCLDAFAADRVGDAWEDLVVGLAVLCHDLGKPSTTVSVEGRIRSPGHEAAGEPPTRAFLGRLTNQTDLIEEILPLVLGHLRPQELFDVQAGDSAIRRLAKRVGRIDRLVRVARADQQGRPPRLCDGFPAGDWLLGRARALEVHEAEPKPIVMGRHLIQLGLTPGPSFQAILRQCYEAQLEGKFLHLDDGLDFVRKMVGRGE